jgi:hypothetical protein
MTNCKKCGHERQSHLRGEGKCQAYLINKESEFYEIEIVPGLKAFTQDIEYGPQCPCKVMFTWLPSSSSSTNVRHTYDEKKGSLHEYGFG